MSTDYIKEAGRKAKGKRPQFFATAESERLFAILLAVVGELAVTRERLDTLERLLAERGGPGSADIDSYRPDSAAARERGLLQQEYIARVFRILQQEREALEEAERGGLPEKSLQEISRELGSP